MRTVFFVIVAALIAGCATAPATTSATTSPTNVTKVYDHRNNTIRYAAKQADSEFVGTSANERAKATPTWYKFGHP